MRKQIRDPGIFLTLEPESRQNIPDPQHCYRILLFYEDNVFERYETYQPTAGAFESKLHS